MRTDDRNGRFKQLYQQYFRRVVRFYVKVCRVSENDAEDLAQIAFLRFYEAMDEYRYDAGCMYFQTIALNVLRNSLRGSKAAKRRVDLIDLDDPEFAYEPAAPAEPDYAERQMSEIQERRLREAIEELPAGQRQCIRLLLAGFKYEEIEQTLRISMDAVKTRLKNARRFLRRRLGEQQLPEDK